MASGTVFYIVSGVIPMLINPVKGGMLQGHSVFTQMTFIAKRLVIMTIITIGFSASCVETMRMTIIQIMNSAIGVIALMTIDAEGFISMTIEAKFLIKEDPASMLISPVQRVNIKKSVLIVMA